MYTIGKTITALALSGLMISTCTQAVLAAPAYASTGQKSSPVEQKDFSIQQQNPVESSVLMLKELKKCPAYLQIVNIYIGKSAGDKEKCAQTLLQLQDVLTVMNKFKKDMSYFSKTDVQRGKKILAIYNQIKEESDIDSFINYVNMNVPVVKDIVNGKCDAPKKEKLCISMN